MNNFASLVNSLIQKNPQIRSNPRNQNMINVIQSGDQRAGEELARNLCKTYGTTPEQALMQAKKFFGLH